MSALSNVICLSNFEIIQFSFIRFINKWLVCDESTETGWRWFSKYLLYFHSLFTKFLLSSAVHKIRLFTYCRFFVYCKSSRWGWICLTMLLHAIYSVFSLSFSEIVGRSPPPTRFFSCHFVLEFDRFLFFDNDSFTLQHTDRRNSTITT